MLQTQSDYENSSSQLCDEVVQEQTMGNKRTICAAYHKEAPAHPHVEDVPQDSLRWGRSLWSKRAPKNPGK